MSSHACRGRRISRAWCLELPLPLPLDLARKGRGLTDRPHQIHGREALAPEPGEDGLAGCIRVGEDPWEGTSSQGVDEAVAELPPRQHILSPPVSSSSAGIWPSIYAGKREVSVGGGNRSPPQAPERAWLKKTLLGSIGREREAFLQLWSLSRREVQIKHKTLQTKSLTGGFWLISNTPLITPPNMHIHTCTRIFILVLTCLKFPNYF
jgi:hypothetical protein